MEIMASAVHSCRLCKGKSLTQFLDLGETPPADRFLFENQLLAKEPYFPLRVMVCRKCGHVQLSHVVSRQLLYCDNYPYESSTTSSGRRHWDEFAETTTRLLRLASTDLVIDVGSNVGVLLQMFKKRGIRTLGVDPATNVSQIANDDGIETIADFFNVDVAKTIVGLHGHASVITATNVFAHIHDLDEFMEATRILLSASGMLVIEAPYFPNLVRRLEYDTIYHEHLSYLSLRPLIRFFSRFDMEVCDVQLRDIHGGSFRMFVRRTSRMPRATIVEELAASEKCEKVTETSTLNNLAKRVASNRDSLRTLLSRLRAEGKRIAGVSAPAKGMTLLNYCGIGADYLDFITEKSTLKIGRYTPGTHIKVVADDMLLERKPDYALLLAWNFAEEIMANLKRYSNAGGKFIIPIPDPQIVG